MPSPHVLLVSRDPDARELYAQWFTQVVDLSTTCTDSVDDATDARTADIVLLDVTQLAQWDECAVLARHVHPTPVVVLTGWVAADRRFRTRAFAAGCAAFICKPCHPRALVAVLGRVLSGERDLVLI